MSNLTIPPQQWLAELFESEYCAECHGDVQDHDAAPFIGNWFAQCHDDAQCRVDDCQQCWCLPCLDGGEPTKTQATWILPQSLDAGVTITYVSACNFHQEYWWDGADWDGSHLEYRIHPNDDTQGEE
jgi:hypothetical protein